MTDIFKTLENRIIKLAESRETNFLLLVKSVYGDTPETLFRCARFASYIYENDDKEKTEIILECHNELKATGKHEYVKKFNQMFPNVSKKNNTTKTAQSTPEPHIVIPKEIYRENLENAVRIKELEMQATLGKEREIFQAQIDKLKNDLANLPQAFEKAQAQIAELKAKLEREGNEIGAEKLAVAITALEQGDFSKADELFAEIEAREELAVKRSARAAFARGKIAEQEVRWYDAAKHYARTAQIDPSFDTLIKAQELAFSIGDYDSALSFGKDAKKAAIKEHGEYTKEYATSLNDIGVVYDGLKEYKLAEPLHKESLKIRQDILGKKHPDIAKSLNNLGGIYYNQKQYRESTYILKRALNMYKEVVGIKHSLTADTLSNLGAAYRELGEFKKAKPFLKRALKIRKEIFGYNHPDIANSYNNLGGLYADQGQYKKAEPFAWQAVEIIENAFGPDHPDAKLFKKNYKYIKKRMPKT